MKLVTWAVLIGGFLFLVFLGYQVFGFWQKKSEAQHNLEVLQQKVVLVESDQRDLQAQLQYLASPNNLEKELRARFNYRGVGEKLMILVPTSSTVPISD